ncbi:ADP-ribosylation factor-like protein 13A [Balearica regulorum gibbericeps]|uniref:ADP-ribosylation factor-like protein 13A n=1 Tax=Balearica regulorum gibbericeps TaxID=100784 RepID=UPI003F62C6BB
MWLGEEEAHVAGMLLGSLRQLSALSPRAALAGEVLPAAQPGQTRLRVDRFEVTLVDLPGGQRSRGAWRSHYSAAHGLLFVLDSSDLARMEEARKVLSRVLSHPDVSGKPILLLANKQDAAAALLPCELIERLSLERLVNENRSPCRIEPCAAKRGPPAGPGRATLQGLRWLLRAATAAPGPPPAAAPPPGPGPGPRAARGRPPVRRWVRGSVRACPRSPPSPPRGSPPSPAVLSPRQGPAAPRGGCPKRRGEDGGVPAAAAHPPPAPPGEWHPPGWDGMEGGVLPPCPHPPYPAQEESAKGPGRRKRKVKVRQKGSGKQNPAEEPEGPGGGGDSRAGAAGGLLPPNRVGQEEPAPTGMDTPHPVQGMKKRKKKKIKNKIKSQEPAVEQQREEVSSTFDLYRRAMLALKMRQEQRKQQSAIVP